VGKERSRQKWIIGIELMLDALTWRKAMLLGQPSSLQIPKAVYSNGFGG